MNFSGGFAVEVVGAIAVGAWSNAALFGTHQELLHSTGVRGVARRSEGGNSVIS